MDFLESRKKFEEIYDWYEYIPHYIVLIKKLIIISHKYVAISVLYHILYKGKSL